ncbi:hypothetical protein [Microbacterium sp. J1-1]|uniref:hypothetical protein n=1 Tax=Microbacterium sp. J1-1 TaxID=2992441 RepID=UPI00211499F3|nr:hypothetical protein [Microbacterium sp. J1-1]UUE22500.1 hypothetical protein LRQ07_18425 [Microbacterium sp. J1-1]
MVRKIRKVVRRKVTQEHVCVVGTEGVEVALVDSRIIILRFPTSEHGESNGLVELVPEPSRKPRHSRLHPPSLFPAPETAGRLNV